MGGILKHGQHSLVVCVAVALCACFWIKKQSRLSSLGLIKNKVYIFDGVVCVAYFSSALKNHFTTYVTSPSIAARACVSVFFSLSFARCVYIV